MILLIVAEYDGFPGGRVAGCGEGAAREASEEEEATLAAAAVAALVSAGPAVEAGAEDEALVKSGPGIGSVVMPRRAAALFRNSIVNRILLAGVSSSLVLMAFDNSPRACAR
jgi:hypothetical protein